MKHVYLLWVYNGRRCDLIDIFADHESAQAEAAGHPTIFWDIERREVKSSLPVPPAEQTDTGPHAPGADISPNVAEDSHRPDILII